MTHLEALKKSAGMDDIYQKYFVLRQHVFELSQNENAYSEWDCGRCGKSRLRNSGDPCVCLRGIKL